jgi:hypothetical protein
MLRCVAGEGSSYGHNDESADLGEVTLDPGGQNLQESPACQGAAKRWKVSDDRLKQYILQQQNVQSRLQPSASASQIHRTHDGHGNGNGNHPKISVVVELLESHDELTLRLPQDLRIGPSKPPRGNRFTDIFGPGASTKGFCMAGKSGWQPAWTSSLKGHIHQLTDIDPSKLIVIFRGVQIVSEHLTLRSLGVQDGERLQIRFQKWEPCQKRNSSLACSRKKEDLQRRREEEDASGEVRLEGYSIKQSKHFKRCCMPGGDVHMRAKWVSQDDPRIFNKVGIAVDGRGRYADHKDFRTEPIFIPDAENCSLGGVRARVTGSAHYQGASKR